MVNGVKLSAQPLKKDMEFFYLSTLLSFQL
jgi:hypothetical protein